MLYKHRTSISSFCVLLINIFLCQTATSQATLYKDGTTSKTGIDTAALLVRGDSSSGKKTGRIAAYIVPAGLFGYGYTALKAGALRRIDTQVQQEVYGKHPHAPFHADNYLEWAPAVAVYGLDAAGVKGAHKFVDRSILYALSFALAQVSVKVLKKNTHQERPDHSDVYAFPSGHTATAFAGAEFLRQEYKAVSPWYGAGGYTTAAATGFLRIYNNKHWLSNTLAGAAIGMASTKLVYWLYQLSGTMIHRKERIRGMVDL
ncbi:MAG: phosphatase PAP2 family protein [Williamsia sp.]|nr:phosphatase PAP2 family protein [Williamsia sp.]